MVDERRKEEPLEVKTLKHIDHIRGNLVQLYSAHDMTISKANAHIDLFEATIRITLERHSEIKSVLDRLKRVENAVKPIHRIENAVKRIEAAGNGSDSDP